MSRHRSLGMLKGTALAGLLLPLVSGCTYDYLQHTDRVAYGAGNAVKANLERETVNPSGKSMYDTTGLGQNGSVIPPASE